MVLGSLSLWLDYEVFRALRTGVANAGGTLIPRRSRPAAFWLTLAAQAGFGFIAAILLVDLWR
jgi:hypothetical protein